MNSIFREQATFRLRADDLLTKTIGGQSQTVAAEFWEAVGGQTAYSLALDAGVFALAGATMNMKAGRTFPLSGGGFTVTGGALGMIAKRKTPFAAGAFSLAGGAVAMRAGRKLALAIGAFTLTGGSMVMKAGRFIAIEPGTIILTGADLDFLYTPGTHYPTAYSLILDAGVFVLTGHALVMQESMKRKRPTFAQLRSNRVRRKLKRQW